jgi:hypothetical protein
MKNKTNTARKGTATKPARKRRLMPSAYEKIRALETLKETEGNAEQVALLGDVLALWTRFMLEVDPSTAAPRIYRALMDAWHENRELHGDDMDAPHDRGASNFHGAFLARFGDLMGEKPALPHWEGKRRHSVEAAFDMIATLNEMRERVHKATALQGESDSAPLAPGFGESPPAKVKELRERLDRIDADDITSCSARMKLEKQIFDLEQERPDDDEWPECIMVGGAR